MAGSSSSAAQSTPKRYNMEDLAIENRLSATKLVVYHENLTAQLHSLELVMGILFDENSFSGEINEEVKLHKLKTWTELGKDRMDAFSRAEKNTKLLRDRAFVALELSAIMQLSRPILWAIFTIDMPFDPSIVDKMFTRKPIIHATRAIARALTDAKLDPATTDPALLRFVETVTRYNEANDYLPDEILELIED